MIGIMVVVQQDYGHQFVSQLLARIESRTVVEVVDGCLMNS